MAKIGILRLEPMCVASAYGFGMNPEELAWRSMVAWVGPKSFFSDIAIPCKMVQRQQSSDGLAPCLERFLRSPDDTADLIMDPYCPITA